MKMEMKYKNTMKRLKEENKELKKVVAIALNKPLLRELAFAIKEIESGEYITEEEFAKKHNLIMSRRRHLITA